MTEIQAQVFAMKPNFAPRLQTSPLKPVVPPKPKILPSHPPTTAKASTATQVNLIARASSSLRSSQQPAAARGTPINASLAVNTPTEAFPKKFPATTTASASDVTQRKSNSDDGEVKKIIRKKQEKIYIRKTEVRKTSETTVIVKPRIPPKPILKPHVSFGSDDNTQETKRGILKQKAVQPVVTRSNSAIIARPGLYNNGTLRPVQSLRVVNNNNGKDPKILPTAVVFTGWRKSKTFPVATVAPAPAAISEIPYYYTTTAGCPLNCLKFANNNSNQRHSRNKNKFTVLNNTNNEQTVQTPLVSPIIIPVPPPRTKRKSLTIETPPPPSNSFSEVVIHRPAVKNSPIYAKVNRNRKTAYKRNIRRYYDRNPNSIYSHEKIEKTSLLISHHDSDHKDIPLQQDDNLISQEESKKQQSGQMDGVVEKSACVVVAVKMKSKASSPVKVSPTVNKLAQSTLKQDWNRIMEDAHAIQQTHNDINDAPVSAPTELPDNSSFLFRLIRSPSQQDLSNTGVHVKDVLLAESVASPKCEQETESSEKCEQEVTSIDVTGKEIDKNDSSENKTIEGVDENPADEIPHVIISPPETVTLEVLTEESPLICEISAILQSRDISIDSIDKLEEDVEIQDTCVPPLDNNNELPTTTALLSPIQDSPSDNEDASRINKARPRRKSSLIDLVDNKIHKVQSLLAEISNSKEAASSQQSLLSVENEVPRTVLLRKSSVPELCSAVLNDMLNTVGNKKETKLTRSSWTNMSTSSVGSTSSSSSAPISMKNRHNEYRKTRRMSDGVFWADEGDTSTGAMGDIETSPYQSSNEDAVNLPGRPTYHRRRRFCSDLFGKARKSNFISTASGIWKTGAQKKSIKTPKIEVLLPDSSSNSDCKEQKNSMHGDEDDDEVDPEIEKRKQAEVELYDKITESLSPKARKAFYVVREILTSEQTFLNVLHLITVDFPESVHKTAERHKMAANTIISEPDLEYILGGLPILKGVNEDLYQDLQERAKTWTEDSKIADIFAKKGAFLKHYTNYIKDFEKISRYFDQLYQKCPNFSRAVREFEGKKKCNHLGLKAFMLKPVQRMPQYSLLLEDYLKQLDEDHVDYDDTIKAIAVVRGVAEHANEAIRLQVSVEQLVALQKRVPHVRIISDGVQLVRQGELLKVRRKELQPRYFSLVTNALFCFSYHGSSGKDLKLKYKLPLTRMKVALPQCPDHEHEFTIISTVRSFNVVAKSTKERDDWIESLRKAIEDFMRRQPNLAKVIQEEESKGFIYGKQAPVWIQDSRVTNCQNCSSEFSITFRRHHCRCCGKIVCRQCSSHEAPLEYLNFEAARVCTPCFQILLKEFEGKVDENETDDKKALGQRFKSLNSSVKRDSTDKRRVIPPGKEKITIHEGDEKLSGYLRWKDRKRWARNWFSLAGSSLHVFDSSEDTHAFHVIRLEGYSVEPVHPDNDKKHESEQVSFKFVREGQQGILFYSENPLLAERWINALSDSMKPSNTAVKL